MMLHKHMAATLPSVGKSIYRQQSVVSCGHFHEKYLWGKLLKTLRSVKTMKSLLGQWFDRYSNQEPAECDSEALSLQTPCSAKQRF
jgi:hypothetical protein